MARQWCGRLGKVDNCQVAIYLGYVSSKGHTLVDTRLYLPKEWTKDKARLDKAGVPQAVRGYRTRHQLALEMLANNGTRLPHRWIAGDDEMGRPSWFRRRLAALGERYLLAVPSNTAIRDLEVEPPASSGRGRRPHVPGTTSRPGASRLGGGLAQNRRARWCQRPAGSRGGQETCRVQDASAPARREEMVVVIRYRDRDNQQVIKVDYYLSNAGPETPLWECARVAKAEHRIEECLQRSKSEAGLADYAVRHWTGWQHIKRFALATWFLVWETERGKKMDPCNHLTTDSSGHRHDLARGVSVWDEVAYAEGVPEALATQ